MLKHQKKGLSRAFSILLAVVLMVSMLPPTVWAAAAPAFADGYPTLGAEQDPGSKRIEVLVKGSGPETGAAYVLLAKDDPPPTPQQIEYAHGNIPGVTVITHGQSSLVSGHVHSVLPSGARDDTEYEFYIICSNGDALSEVWHQTVKTPAAGAGDPDPLPLDPPTGLRWDIADSFKAKWDAVAGASSYTVALWRETPSGTETLPEYTVSTGTEISFQSNIAGSPGRYFFTVQAVAEDNTPGRSLKPAGPIYEEPVKCSVPGCQTPVTDGGFAEKTNETYHISTPEQLAHIDRHLYLDYIQTEDIDLSGYSGWTPIGKDAAFTGEYFGNARKITGLNIDITSTDGSDLYGGLFGMVDLGAHIEGIDLSIDSMSAVLTASESLGKIYLGGIAAEHISHQTIRNCHVTLSGDITAKNFTSGGEVYIGGIAGYNSGSITGCGTDSSDLAAVTVAAKDGKAFIGGIAGYTRGEILHSDHRGKLRAEAGEDEDETYTQHVYVGGIAGYAEAAGADMRIENCQNDADIESINTAAAGNEYRAYAGGIVGHIHWDGSGAWAVIENCGNIGSDKRVYTEAPSTMTGGIAGSSRFNPLANIRIENCYNRSDVVSRMPDTGWAKRQALDAGAGLCTGVTAGGIIGAAGGLEVLYSYSSAATVSAEASGDEDAYFGGIAGVAYDTRFTQNYYETNESITVGVGGAVSSDAEIVSQPDEAEKVEGADAAGLKTKSRLGEGWQWYEGGGIAPDYYSFANPWRFTAANSYPVLRGAPYTAATPPGNAVGPEAIYTIHASANEGGTITPAGKSQVAKYNSITFTIGPKRHHLIEDVLVDGVSVGAVTTYVFPSVKGDHTIQAIFAHDCPSRFYTDVDITQWYHEAIDDVLLAGLFEGTSGAMFQPGAPMTRAMMVTVLWRLENEPDAATAGLFSDIAHGTWYTRAIAWAAENMIVKGYDADTFGPEDPITREQLAAILYRCAQYRGYDTGIGQDVDLRAYDDANRISDYAISAVQWACGSGIMQGDGTKLNPQGCATRAETAAMIARFIENAIK